MSGQSWCKKIKRQIFGEHYKVSPPLKDLLLFTSIWAEAETDIQATHVTAKCEFKSGHKSILQWYCSLCFLENFMHWFETLT
jgi:hypothetical protein